MNKLQSISYISKAPNTLKAPQVLWKRRAVLPSKESIEVPTVLPLSVHFDTMKRVIPEVRAMVGLDQRTPHHLLTLDRHSEEAWRNVLDCPVMRQSPYRYHAALAMALHDVGKVPCIEQAGSMEPVRYADHEALGQKSIGAILERHFVGVPPKEKQLILKLAGLSANELFRIRDGVTISNVTEAQAYDTLKKSIMDIEEIADPSHRWEVAISCMQADKLAAFDVGVGPRTFQEEELQKKRIEQVGYLEVLKYFSV